MNVIDISTKLFGNIFPTGAKNWFELSAVSRNRGWNYRAKQLRTYTLS